MRAAIYSRFSTDLQNEKSIEHQEVVGREFAKREGLKIVGVYSDAAVSGASILGRDGLLQMLADAKTNKFDVVVVEALDRLSRDMEDLAGIHKRLTFAGGEIRAIHEGVVNTVLVGLRGLVGQLYREDLAHKTRRGLQGKVAAGLVAAGAAYGYRMDPLQKGRPIIIEEEAEVIRRIYREYLSGRSARKIAADLNAEGVPGPRSRKWMSTTIFGWHKRGTGILRNQLYNGQIVWNRTRFTKDPDTGRRVSKLNDVSQYVTKAAPDYRIIEQALFEEVQQKLGTRALTPSESGGHETTETPFVRSA